MKETMSPSWTYIPGVSNSGFRQHTYRPVPIFKTGWETVVTTGPGKTPLLRLDARVSPMFHL